MSLVSALSFTGAIISIIVTIWSLYRRVDHLELMVSLLLKEKAGKVKLNITEIKGEDK